MAEEDLVLEFLKDHGCKLDGTEIVAISIAELRQLVTIAQLKTYRQRLDSMKNVSMFNRTGDCSTVSKKDKE